MQIAREYNEDVGSPMYQQILRVLNLVNEDRATKGQPRVTFRQAVQSMGLKDPFTGKIKSGVYVPTLERLEMLAAFLDVHPTIFDVYVKRYADKVIREGALLEFFRQLAALNTDQQKVMISAVEHYMNDIYVQYRRPRRDGPAKVLATV